MMRRNIMTAKMLFCAALIVAGCAGQTFRRNTDLVDVRSAVPGIITDIRYATADNFTKQRLYDTDRCFLRRGTAVKLARVQEDLAKTGLSLKIFDGYRPLSIQKKMWKIMPDENYVADPVVGSFHNRGVAVDVTLVDGNGRELPMGTEYDAFTEKAHLDFKALPEDVLRNRRTLVRVMIKNGFTAFRTEWWHYSDKDAERYPIEDIDCSKLH